MKTNTFSIVFHVAQLKYGNRFYSLIQHTNAAHAHIKPRSSWFTLDIMSALHPYLVSFQKTTLNKKIDEIF